MDLKIKNIKISDMDIYIGGREFGLPVVMDSDNRYIGSFLKDDSDNFLATRKGQNVVISYLVPDIDYDGFDSLVRGQVAFGFKGWHNHDLFCSSASVECWAIPLSISGDIEFTLSIHWKCGLEKFANMVKNSAPEFDNYGEWNDDYFALDSCYPNEVEAVYVPSEELITEAISYNSSYLDQVTYVEEVCKYELKDLNYRLRGECFGICRAFYNLRRRAVLTDYEYVGGYAGFDFAKSCMVEDHFVGVQKCGIN